MADQEVTILIKAEDEASQVMDGLSEKTGGWMEGLQRVGPIAAGMGAAVTGALAMCVKGAAEEETGYL